MSNIHSYRTFPKTIKSFLKTSAIGSTIKFNTPGSERIRSFQKTGRTKFREINLKNPANAIIPLQPIRKFVNKTTKNTSPKKNTSPAKPRSLPRTQSFIRGGRRRTKRHHHKKRQTKRRH